MTKRRFSSCTRRNTPINSLDKTEVEPAANNRTDLDSLEEESAATEG